MEKHKTQLQFQLKFLFGLVATINREQNVKFYLNLS